MLRMVGVDVRSARSVGVVSLTVGEGTRQRTDGLRFGARDSPLTARYALVSKRFAAFAWGVLVYSLAVIGWGYYLRVSESGDGCGTDWPLCEGSFVPVQASFPTWVEYLHRLSSGTVLLLVLGMAIWAVRALGRDHPVARAAAWSLVFTVTESMFGALLVVAGWVAGDFSAGRVLIRPFQVTNTFLLMAALGLTAWFASRGVQEWTTSPHQRGARMLRAGLLLIFLAATGSWAGLAGTAFPVESLSEGLGQYLGPEHLLIYLRTVHPIVAALTAVFIVRVGFEYRRQGASGTERRLALAMMSLVAAQLVLGSVTILLLHPVSLRLLHLIAADLLWLNVVFLWSCSREGRGARPGRTDSPPRGSVQIQPGAALP